MPRGRKPLHSYNETETHIIERLSSRGKALRDLRLAADVEYHERGNFTVAVVPTRAGIKLGVAKRNPMDHYSPQIGRNVAFARAIHI